MTGNSGVWLQVVMALIMWGIGLSVPLQSFKRVFVAPKAIITGLALQMLLLPAVGFLLAWLWPLEPVHKAGLVLIAACPGGTASNLVTHLLKGRVALSISLTAFNSFLILFTIPIVVSLGNRAFLGSEQAIALSVSDTLMQLGTTVLLPVVVGVWVRQAFPSFAERIRKPLRYILLALLLLMFGFAALQQDGGQSFRWQWLPLVWPALLLNLVTMLLGFVLPWFLGVSRDGRFTIAIEMGLQNSALAIYLAYQVLGNGNLAIVPVVYSGFSFFTTYALAYLMRGKMRA